MDIQRKAFEESNNVNPDWSFKFDEELQQYVAVDFEMTNQVDEFNEHWDTFRAGWDAKAQATPEGLVLVPKKLSDEMNDHLWDFMTDNFISTNEDGDSYIACDDFDLRKFYSEIIEAQEQKA
jgi:hypothetical protein